MERCGYRYHVFNCKKHTDSIQVKELLDKIEEMVMENNGRRYVPDEKSNPSTELQAKIKRAKKDTEKKHRQDHILQNLLKEREEQLSEIRIVLLGREGVGKSTSGNMIMQGDFFETTLEEGFKDQRRTSRCVMKQGKVEEYHISVVDTPGWSTSHLNHAKEIFCSVKVCSPGPHAFLLVLPLNQSFRKKSEQTVKELMNLFGEHLWKHTLIIFSGSWLKDRPVEQYIACEGEALQSLIRKCGNRYYKLDHKSQSKNLLKMIGVMVAKNRGEYFTTEKKEKTSTSLFQRLIGKVLTEEEWNKREDELIDKMLEAAVVDLDEESNQPSARQKASYEYGIPSMSGDSLSDTVNSIGVKKWEFFDE
ncbi:GTPase IMAP family member 7 [Danio rerio]|uniref:GTPase IMAP family member 7 n=2 Tax=Danio rerio TaxID=7955 RepID=A0AC58IAD3_DANRE|nr:GTPase IMAP family member 4-like isoform X1 [Danio rerio]|eukprot:XP_005161177.2 GTPase IMAP family member 4-like isoform X1 [Danio rerio]